MPLLKHTQIDQIAHDAIVLDLGDLRKQAERLKAAAQAQADRIIAQAQAQAQRLTGEAHGIGHAAGFEAGKAQGLEQGRAEGKAEALAAMQEQLEQLHHAWAATLDELDARQKQMRLDARHDLIALALAIAEKVTKRIPQVQPECVVDQLGAAIEQIAHPSDLTVTIHPDDRSLVEEALPALCAKFDNAQHVRLADSADIAPGGCVLRYGRGRIDATLQTQLDRIVHTLLPGTRVAVDSAERSRDADDAAAPRDDVEPSP